jgi:hypothetical protein
LRPEIKVLFVTGYTENAAVRGGFLDRGHCHVRPVWRPDRRPTRLTA